MNDVYAIPEFLRKPIAAPRERPILFSAPMIRALLAGTKTQTRRIVKPQPELIYRITGDSIAAAYNSGALYGFDFPSLESRTATNPRIAELGLHGGLGWQYLLANTIQRLREKSLSELVSIAWARNKQGVLDCLVVPRKQKGNEIGSSVDLHGVSRNARSFDAPDEAQGRSKGEQQADESHLGNPNRELGGPGSTRARHEGREAPDVQVDGRGARASAMGLQDEAMQSATCGSLPWNVPGCNVRIAPFYQGLRLWVRETCRAHEITDSEADTDAFGIVERLGLEQPPYGLDGVVYLADGAFREIENTPEAGDAWGVLHSYRGKRGATVPPIHMPRWASRILLEIVAVRVERLQDISEADAEAEGCEPFRHPTHPSIGPFSAGYSALWDSINGAGSWAANPWIWCLTFKRVPP